MSDSTGHGLDGTIFSLFVKTTIASFIELTSTAEVTPASILRFLDKQLRQGGFPSECAVTIFLLVIDLDTKDTAYAAAGFHNAPILVTEDGEVETLPARGLPITRDVPQTLMDFAEHGMVFPANSALLLATDGLYEQRGADASIYEGRLVSLLRKGGGLPEKTLIDWVRNDFDEFRGDQDQADDTTLVVLTTIIADEHTIPSTFDALAQVRERAQTYYRNHSVVDDITMAVHELVANAIEHGNHFSKEKYVSIQFSACAVVVEDEGDGFNWRTRVREELGLSLHGERGRGIAMVQLLVGRLVYNQIGNRVSLVIPS